MSLKLLIKSVDRRFLLGTTALIFMLVMTLSDVTLSQESQAGKDEVLRKASLRWIQVGIEQYQGDLFTEAELSFRRALVFQKYLTAAERERLDKYMSNARIAISEGKQAVASTQTADVSVEPKTAAIVKKVEDRRQTTEVIDKKSEQPALQKEPSVEAAEPAMSKIQVTAGSSGGVSIFKDGSFNSKLMQLSSWLSVNRLNILMICLPLLAVLVFISKLQARRKRPGRRVYSNHVPSNTSFIGSNLNGSNEKRRPGKVSKKARSASSAAERPERKSFKQSTEHWKKEPAGLTPDARKPFRNNKNTPQRKDKFEDDAPAVPKPEQKQCGKCGEFKDLSDFHKDKSCKDGLARWCKECKAKAARESRKKRAAEKK